MIISPQSAWIVLVVEPLSGWPTSTGSCIRTHGSVTIGTKEDLLVVMIFTLTGEL